ncbi:glycosyltransferase [Methylacidiphilum kamchatkense]|nr:glycosyltransferase [Methylacidiphilum kamchatkense]
MAPFPTFFKGLSNSSVKNSFIAQRFSIEKIFVLTYKDNFIRFYPRSKNLEKQPSKKFKVLCVGPITLPKGHIDLLEAWKRLKFKDADLILLDSIDHLMKPILYQYKYSFINIEPCSWEKVYSYYHQASVFVLPSIENRFGYVIHESMVIVFPIIATTNTGASGILETRMNFLNSFN